MSSELWASVMVGANLSQEPSIAPVPTVVVEPQVTIPPELIEQLTPPDPGWFTQPVATILAALIAVGAATIAYRGVLRQIRATEGNVERQIKAEQVETERKDRFNALFEAISILEDSKTLMQRVGLKAEREGLMERLLLDQQRRSTARVRLLMVGLRKSAAGMSEVEEQVHKALVNYRTDEDGYLRFAAGQQINKLRNIMQKEYSALHPGSFIPPTRISDLKEPDEDSTRSAPLS